MTFIQDKVQRAVNGAADTSEACPVIQASAQYGVLRDVNSFFGPSGSISVVKSLYSCESGVNANGFAGVATSNNLPFRPGQGERDEFNFRLSAGQVNSEQFSGLANSNAAVGFGNNQTEFGTLFRYGGEVPISELTQTSFATAAETSTVTINGTAYSVNLSGAGSLQDDAREIAASLSAQVPLWFFDAIDDQVVAMALISLPATGLFDFSSATATATWAQISEGALPIDEWTAKANWSELPNIALDLSNIIQAKIQIGAGLVIYSIMDASTNNYEVVHIVNKTNSSNELFIENPSFGHTWYALNRGGVASVTTEGGFSGLFREGPDRILAATASIQNTLVGVSTTPIPIITLRGRGSIAGVINLAKAIITGLQVTSTSTRDIIVTLTRDGVLTDPVFQYIDKSGSMLEADVSAIAVTGGSSVTTQGLTSVAKDVLAIAIHRRQHITKSVNVSANPASDFIATVPYLEDL